MSELESKLSHTHPHAGSGRARATLEHLRNMNGFRALCGNTKKPEFVETRGMVFDERFTWRRITPELFEQVDNP